MTFGGIRWWKFDDLSSSLYLNGWWIQDQLFKCPQYGGKLRLYPVISYNALQKPDVVSSINNWYASGTIEYTFHPPWEITKCVHHQKQALRWARPWDGQVYIPCMFIYVMGDATNRKKALEGTYCGISSVVRPSVLPLAYNADHSS